MDRPLNINLRFAMVLLGLKTIQIKQNAIWDFSLCLPDTFLPLLKFSRSFTIHKINKKEKKL